MKGNLGRLFTLDLDECPRCGYGPLGIRRKERRKKCPACTLVLPWPAKIR